jgi:stage II sporulation protein P
LILNYSSNRNIDFESIISKDVILTKKSDKILLYSTHTSESYTNSENYKFEYSSVMRSLDAKYNMISIAKELNQNLLKKGFSSIHNTTPHDYGAYTGAYLKSRETVVNALTNMGSAGIIIDVHRDAMEDLTFRPVANINGIQVSQLMFVVGIGDNKYWEDNLRLALKLQEIANNIYPGLFRQIVIRDSTYNQDLNKYSMLVEFGATGNTIDEVKLSTRCLANLLNIIYKD